MAINPASINCTITSLARPSTSGVGGKVVTTTLIQTSIPAHRQPFNAFATAGDFLSRDTDAVRSIADNSFFMDLLDAQELIRLVKPGDLLVWVSTRSSGPVSSPLQDEVVRANIWEAPGFNREHVEIFVRGQVG